jgi:hypothetical protein
LSDTSDFAAFVVFTVFAAGFAAAAFLAGGAVTVFYFAIPMASSKVRGAIVALISYIGETASILACR